ncbi:MAG: hypothetical protein K0S27_1247 [Gammaproteobacteria bacterium]|jgi:hypothetical protein|nr:hypothetical protein [Gammaproteobacteria bacterium]
MKIPLWKRGRESYRILEEFEAARKDNTSIRNIANQNKIYEKLIVIKNAILKEESLPFNKRTEAIKNLLDFVEKVLLSQDGSIKEQFLHDYFLKRINEYSENERKYTELIAILSQEKKALLEILGQSFPIASKIKIK